MGLLKKNPEGMGGVWGGGGFFVSGGLHTEGGTALIIQRSNCFIEKRRDCSVESRSVALCRARGLGQQPDQKSTKWAVVESPPIVDGSQLRTANAILNRLGAYEIQFALNTTGAEKFGAWTGANINECLGVVLNGELKSVALIKSQISDQGVISGGFTEQAAEDLALTLKSGALPGRLIVINESNDK